MALIAKAIESAIERSAAINFVSFFNTGTSSIKNGPAVRTVLYALPFHVKDELVAARAYGGY
ncbi:MAG: hypothetical protein WBL48_13630 [Pseudolabrys sp.]